MMMDEMAMYFPNLVFLDSKLSVGISDLGSKICSCKLYIVPQIFIKVAYFSIWSPMGSNMCFIWT